MPQRSQMEQQAGQEVGHLVGEVIKLTTRSVCLSIELLLHETFGLDYVQGGPMVILVAFAFLHWFPGDDPRPLAVYVMVVLALWVNATAQALLRRYWRGRAGEGLIHSRYTGRPFVLGLVPRWPESTVKQLEAVGVVLLGLAVRRANHPLGDYVVGAASVLLLRTYCTAARERGEAVAMADAMIDQTLAGQRFRDLQDG